MVSRIILRPEDGPSSPDFEVPLAWMRKIKALMAKDTHRGKQVVVGPSGIGDPCEVCLARMLAAKLSNTRSGGRVSLSSWMGTAVHFYMEAWFESPEMRALFPTWRGEMSVPCGVIPGYGEIEGHIDGYVVLPTHQGLVIDWKVVGANTFKKMQAFGMGDKYDHQRQTYGYGVELLQDPEMPVDFVANFIMKAGSGQPGFQDVLIDIDHYRPEMAINALTRAGVIWNDYVLTDMMSELVSDPDCYTCNGYGDYM